MAITDVQVASANTGTGSGLTALTLGTLSGAALNDVVILFGWCERSVAPTPTGGTSAWTTLRSETSTNYSVTIAWKLLQADELTASFGWSTPTAKRGGGGFVVRRGVGAVSVVNGTRVTTFGNATFQCPSATPVANDAQLLGMAVGARTSAPLIANFTGHGSGYTEIIDQSSQAAAQSNAFGSVAQRLLTGGAGVSQTGDAAVPSAAGEYMASTVVLEPGAFNAAPTSGISASVATPVDPGQPFTLTLVENDDTAVTTRTFRQVSGPAAYSISGTGLTRTVVAPPTLAGGTMVFGYKVGDAQGAESAEATVSVTLNPSNRKIVVTGGPTPTFNPTFRRINRP